jgi:hypothetical protein
MADYIVIQFPEKISLEGDISIKFRELNPSLVIVQAGNQLKISEGESKIFDSDFFELLLPFSVSNEYYKELCELNDYKIESNKSKLIIYMGADLLIATFTALILVVVANWAKTNKN